jgi:hypothetical protein
MVIKILVVFKCIRERKPSLFSLQLIILIFYDANLFEYLLKHLISFPILILELLKGFN